MARNSLIFCINLNIEIGKRKDKFILKSASFNFESFDEKVNEN